MAMTTAAQKHVQIADMAPGSVSQSGTAATIMHISVQASMVCTTMSAMPVHDRWLRRLSMAQQRVGTICTVWATSWRKMAHSGCCERGTVPQAPSQRGGMYVTGDDGEGFMLATGAIIGGEPILGETSGEGVAEKS